MNENKGPLFAAMAAVQAELKNPVMDKSNPYFKSKYLDLATLTAHVNAVASKHGVAVIQYAEGMETNAVHVYTVVGHESGASMTFGPLTLAPLKADPQGMGGAMTYGRRYQLAAVFNLSGDDDDDGNSISRNDAPAQRAQPSTNGNGRTPDTLDDVAEDPTFAASQGTPFAWPDSRSNEGEYLLSVASQFSPDGDTTTKFSAWFIEQHNASGDKRWSTVSTRADGKQGQGQYGLAVRKLDDRYGRESHRYILSALMGRIVEKDYIYTVPGWKTKEVIDWLMKPDEWKNKLSALDALVEELKNFLLSMMEDLTAEPGG